MLDGLLDVPARLPALLRKVRLGQVQVRPPPQEGLIRPRQHAERLPVVCNATLRKCVCVCVCVYVCVYVCIYL